MKSKIPIILNLILSAIIAFTFPICLGLIYMDITGHSKGFDYNLGSEKDVSVAMGIIELAVWLLIAVPSNVYVFRSLKNKRYALIIISTYFALFMLCIFMIGGWNEFAHFFHG